MRVGGKDGDSGDADVRLLGFSEFVCVGGGRIYCRVKDPSSRQKGICLYSVGFHRYPW